MTTPSDPNWHWDGERWLYWNGTAWVAPPSAPPPVDPGATPTPEPAGVAAAATDAAGSPTVPLAQPVPLGYPDAQPPRKRSKAPWIIAGAAGAVLVIVIGAGIAASVGSGTTNLGSGSGSSTTPSTNPFPSEPTLPSDTPTPTPTTDSSGSVGDTFSVTALDGTSYSVTVTGVTDPGHAKDPTFEKPNAGDRYVSARFVVKGITGNSTGDVYNNATIIGSDDQTYEGDFSDVKGCTSFDSGEWKVAAGKQAIGCAMFQVPKGVTVKAVQWDDNLDTPATWTLG